jgi:AraC-like DNA-binding protein
MSEPPHVDATGLVVDLLGAVPHVMLCVKGADGRYVAANDAFVRRARRRRLDEIIGRRASDLFPTDLAASYEAQDRAVLRTGRPVRNHLELITHGRVADDREGGRWYLTSKVLSEAGSGPVVVVLSVDANLGNRANVASGLRAAVELANEHVDAPLRVADLARAAGMSTDRLERAMRRSLGISPKQYLIRQRAERAAMLLATTDRSIAAIAADCGYYDQSQLTRQFRAHAGMTPSDYRSVARA